VFYLSIPDIVSEVVAATEKFFRECNDINLLVEWLRDLPAMKVIDVGIKGRFVDQKGSILYSKIHPLISCFNRNEFDFTFWRRPSQMISSSAKNWKRSNLCPLLITIAKNL
jgi:hypothetical protein